MKSNERIRVQPMPADAVPTVDQDHADVRMINQGVGEGHAHGTRADHHIVRLQHLERHGPMLTARRTLVNGTCGPESLTFPDQKVLLVPKKGSSI